MAQREGPQHIIHKDAGDSAVQPRLSQIMPLKVTQKSSGKMLIEEKKKEVGMDQPIPAYQQQSQKLRNKLLLINDQITDRKKNIFYTIRTWERSLSSLDTFSALKRSEVYEFTWTLNYFYYIDNNTVF